jgi:hypothetical protein
MSGPYALARPRWVYTAEQTCPALLAAEAHSLSDPLILYRRLNGQKIPENKALLEPPGCYR